MKPVDGFIKDGIAAINVDNSALASYKMQKNKNREIDILKEEVKELKSVLYQILEKVSK
jgi:hypothetical protein